MERVEAWLYTLGIIFNFNITPRKDLIVNHGTEFESVFVEIFADERKLLIG